jgi:hypothetical protein
MAMLLFPLHPRHADGAGSSLCFAAFWPADRFGSRRGICDMQYLSPLLRSIRSRIRRRLSLIVAIAAASLPAAGA